jgi:hypothetical protein
MRGCAACTTTQSQQNVEVKANGSASSIESIGGNSPAFALKKNLNQTAAAAFGRVLLTTGKTLQKLGPLAV